MGGCKENNYIFKRFREHILRIYGLTVQNQMIPRLSGDQKGKVTQQSNDSLAPFGEL